MLSKLDFFGSSEAIPESADQRRALRDALERKIQPTSIISAEGGTLGVCYHVEVAGSRRFLKTHLPSDAARSNLTNETDILRRLYDGKVVLDCFEVTPDGSPARLCMLMAALSPLSQPMQPNESAAMVRDYTSQLAQYRPVGLSPVRDFAHYVAHGRRAITILTDQGLVGKQIAEELERLLATLSVSLGTLPKALCHGDFGPRNIMTDGVRKIAIDWEDAFDGVEGYDYLYWLTFMDNRRFLQTEAFGRTNLSAETERAILALIVVLKSYLSVQAKAHIGHKMSIESRLAEVLAIPQTA